MMEREKPYGYDYWLLVWERDIFVSYIRLFFIPASQLSEYGTLIRKRIVHNNVGHDDGHWFFISKGKSDAAAS